MSAKTSEEISLGCLALFIIANALLALIAFGGATFACIAWFVNIMGGTHYNIWVAWGLGGLITFVVCLISGISCNRKD